MKNLGIFGLLLFVLYFVGWCMSVVKFINSDFEPSYKREIVYGIGVFTSLGGIIGWFDIPDNPKEPVIAPESDQ